MQNPMAHFLTVSANSSSPTKINSQSTAYNAAAAAKLANIFPMTINPPSSLNPFSIENILSSQHSQSILNQNVNSITNLENKPSPFFPSLSIKISPYDEAAQKKQVNAMLLSMKQHQQQINDFSPSSTSSSADIYSKLMYFILKENKRLKSLNTTFYKYFSIG
jgi:hypothetical protein